MFFKKKLKISRGLANIMYILEKDSKCDAKAFSNVVDIIWDVAYLSGGFKMMNNTFKYLVDLRKRSAE